MSTPDGWHLTPVEGEALAAIPEASRPFLSEVGLPEGIEIWMANIRAILFTPSSLQPIQFQGVDYVQVGYSRATDVFKNLPANPIAIECTSGTVYLLNGIELASGGEHKSKLPRWFFNSDIEKLVRTLAAYVENLPIIEAHHQYVAEREKAMVGLSGDPLLEIISELRQHGQQVYETIRPQLEAIDPAALDSSHRLPSIWLDTLVEIRWSSSSPAAS